jgi:hypothetical protein
MPNNEVYEGNDCQSRSQFFPNQKVTENSAEVTIGYTKYHISNDFMNGRNIIDGANLCCVVIVTTK